MRHALGFVVVAFGLVACATPMQVKTRGKTGTDFARYRTFAVLPINATGVGTDFALVRRLAEPARQAVVESLAKHGLKEAALTQADLVVYLRGASIAKMEVTEWDAAEQHKRDLLEYDKRLLAVELYDTHTKALVWVGQGSRTTSEAIQVEQVTAAIRKILGKYPATTTQ